MFFFIGAAIKIAVLVSWHTTLVSLSYSDDLQLEIQERSWYENVMVKMLLWMCCAFGFEFMPYPSRYLNSILDKTHHRSVIALFSVQLQQLF